MEYRRELKFLCSSGQLCIIDNNISPLTVLDANAGEEGMYTIRSVYFDDFYDTAMGGNEDGINERLKVRIRIYNADDSLIKLEFKYKENGLTKKQSVSISREMADKLLAGRPLSIEDIGQNPVLNMMAVYTHTKRLMPKVIVEYDRKVFRYDWGNVRITFDKDIRYSSHVDTFFDKDINTIPVLNAGHHILEVKYDELLPSHISNAMDIGSLSQTTFSKYYLSRLALRGDFYEF